MTANTDTKSETTQATQFSFNGSKPGPNLASLASATEPAATNFSFNFQQPSVATFPPKTSNGSPTAQANNAAPFGFSFAPTTASGPNQAFQFTNPTSSTAPARFSFSSLPQKTSPVAQPVDSPATTSKSTQPTDSSATTSKSTQPTDSSATTSKSTQPTDSSATISKSTQPADSSATTPKNMQPADSSATTSKSMQSFEKKFSDPPTAVPKQPSASNREQYDAETSIGMAEGSLLSKKVHNTLRDPKALVVDRNDPNSPLYAMTSFEELNLKPDLLKSIYAMGFQKPSKIQSIALPRLLDNPPKNIIAQSQSGTGKTASFSLAILSRIDPANQSPQALILAPTFELAIQIGAVIERMAHFLPYIKLAYATNPESVVIGTPGTVEEWCLKLKMIDLSRLSMCCVDEADVMIATQGFQENCMRLVNGLNGPRCQMMLFSATYSDEVMGFARQIVPDPIILRLKREKQSLVNIKQYFVQCYDDELKYHTVEQIYASLTVGQAMIFCRTKATARNLSVRLANQNHSVRELTAALDVEQRASIIHGFRNGIFRVLVSTNVSSRGLDIDDVSLVINYDMPMTMAREPDYETYLHRIGRCGRFGKQGYTFNLISSEEDFITMKQIEEYFSHTIDEISMEGIAHLEQED